MQLHYDDLFVLLNLLRPDLIIDKETFYNMAEPNTYINQAAAIVRHQPDGWQRRALDAVVSACATIWGKNVISNSPTAKSVLELLRKDVVILANLHSVKQSQRMSHSQRNNRHSMMRCLE